jgi:integrase
VKRASCKPGNHQPDCKNDDQRRVNIAKGCSSNLYWRARARVLVFESAKPKSFEGVGTTEGRAKTNLQRNIAKAIAAARESGDAPLETPADKKKVTVRELADLWYENYLSADSDLSDGTKERYWRVVNRICAYQPDPSKPLDTFGQRTVVSVKASQLKKLLAAIPVLNEQTGEYSQTSYVKTTYFVLRHVFMEAVSEDIRVGSPMLFIPAPKISVKAVVRAARPITVEEYGVVRELILHQPRHSPYLLPLLDVLALSGMRVGEALALQRRDLFRIHNAEPILALTGHVIMDGGSAVRVSGLKEAQKTGTREMVVNDVLADILREWIEKMTDKSPNALLFSTRANTVIQPANLRRTLRKLAEAPGAPQRMSPHSFRKMVGQIIDVERADDGYSAADYLGNSPAIAAKHYREQKVRRSSAELGEIVAEKVRLAMPERFAS